MNVDQMNLSIDGKFTGVEYWIMVMEEKVLAISVSRVVLQRQVTLKRFRSKLYAHTHTECTNDGAE